MPKNDAFTRVEPDIKKWPIHKLSQDKDNFLELFVAESLKSIKSQYPNPQALEDELVSAVYSENIRLKQNPWKVDSKDEKVFWGKLKKALVKRSLQPEAERDESIHEEIVKRYAQEIMGNFNERTYKFAEKATAQVFNRLLNPTKLFGNKGSNQGAIERIKLFGEIEKIRSLSKKGTVILLPTHHSNLDSILIGWAINHIGLPAFLYGAGLNLFNSSIFGFYMNRLGAYKIDRRKKNKLYLETLKTYSRLSIQRGCHTLFFPGGTRARSGQLETRLKLGLLSTVLDAQRLNFTNPLNEESSKIFIVPLVISYHFVLEAGQLIDQHLKRKGKEKYFVGKDSVPSVTLFANFFRKLVGSKTDIVLNFGEPMDVFGQKLNADGESLDGHGNVVDIKSFFESNGKITDDPQRTSEYTRLMADKVKEAYLKENMVLTSHLCAYSAYEILKKRHRRLDIYGLMRLPKEDREIPYTHFMKVIGIVLDALKEKYEEDELTLSPMLKENNLEQIVEYGIKNLGIYHNKKPLYKTKKGDLSSEDMKLLYFYHNRMVGYGTSNYF